MVFGFLRLTLGAITGRRDIFIKAAGVVLALQSLLSSEPALAQASGQSLDSVAIHENRIRTRLPAQSRRVQVITADDIKKLPVRSVNELLGYLSGVDIRQRGPWGAQADVGIDGSGFDQVLVLLNGVKMSDPQTGHHGMNLPVPLSAIDHIEVLHGSAARVYGVNALAGAINVVTRIPERNSAGVQVYGGSSFASDTSTGETYYGYGVQAFGALSAGAGSHLVSVSRDAGNGYRYNTAYRSDRVYYENKIRVNAKNGIQATGAYLRNQFGAGLFYAAPSDKEATETTQTAVAAVSWDHHPNSRLQLTPRLSYRYNKDDYIYTRKNPAAYHNIHESNVATGELQGSYQLGSGTIGAGLEYRSEGIRSTNLGRHDRSNLGAFAEYRHRFGSRATLNGGLYLNNNSDWGLQVYPGVDGAVVWGKHWKAFANLSSGQRLPTYTDLYYRGPTNIGNPDLKAEFATYANSGLRYSQPFLSAQAGYFVRRTSDFIDWVRSGSAAPWQPQNFGLVYTQGVNAELDLAIAKLVHTGLRELNLRVAYSHLTENLDEGEAGTTKYTSSLLRHQFIARLNASKGLLSGGINARYCERVQGGAYTLLDGRIACQTGFGRYYLEATNLLNADYFEAGAVPMPGRWLTVGAVFEFN
jgi:iron complex outermembrane receptor protein